MRAHRPGGGRADRRPPRALAAAAALATAAAVLDVLADGPLRHLDQWVFSGGLPPRTGAWHWTWRTIVNGGQYWIVGSLAGITAVTAAWRRRSVPLLLRAGVWLACTELVVRAAQVLFARTAPLYGADEMFAAGHLSFPSGHAANAAACLPFIAAMAGAPRRWTIAAHTLAALVAVAVVALGYHWPTDALAGWGIGTLLACAARVLVVPGEPARDGRRRAGAATATPADDA
ncbi:phosphatase PAP2 family protein [Actinomadura sp. NPDC048394]|uniref:phosphatase PAP2 family protein n=1 Tax=Actinomadura sp. NPDC048394 TaxID=3158223 RepID=UPI00340E1C53